MAIIIVDGKRCEVPRQDETQDLLTALVHLGFNVPYFCWHPALGSVGACRLCAVKLHADDADQRGKIVMSCMTPVADGMRVAVEDQEVVQFRRRVIEWLMVNHPHDCPVCDEGGECHLQDMAVMTGHIYRRYRGRKRTFRNQDLGPLIAHEMNRCIQCYRCVRLYRDFCGGRDFDVFACGNHTYFGRHEDGRLESEFSGNIIEICPTGVFTDKTLRRHYTRKWDLESAPSICPHCGRGCNTIPGARYQMLRRIHARYHPEINGFFICDRGRFGYEFVNHPRRLRQPQVGGGAEVDWRQALAAAAEGLSKCRHVIGIGSPRASVEANYALKAMVGADAFCGGMSGREHDGMKEALAILRRGPSRSAPLREAERADAVLILACDPTNEAPMLDLAIRQASFHAAREQSRRRNIPDWNDYPARAAIGDARGKLYIAAPARIKLEQIATEALHAPPPQIAALGWQIAAALAAGAYDHQTLAGRIAAGMAAARKPLVVASATGGVEALRAAAEIARALSVEREAPCLISIIAPECDSMGAAMLGGFSVDEALRQIESGAADGAVVVENDLFRRAHPQRIADALRRVQYLVVMDALATRTSEAADAVLPATPNAECTGTYVNDEGRAQRFYQVFAPAGAPRESWRIVRDLIEARQPGAVEWPRYDDVVRALAQSEPALAAIAEAAPPATWRDRVGAAIARETHRSSGRAAENAQRSVFEPQPPADPDSPFAFTMEGTQEEPPAALIPRYWSPGWNSVQALHRFAIEARGPAEAAVGKRLIEPGVGEAALTAAPAESQLAADELWVVPWPAIFGSEELSRLAEGIAAITPPAAVTLRPDDARRRGVTEGDMVQLEIDGRAYALPAQLSADGAPGVALVPAGYPETAGLDGAARARIVAPARAEEQA
jgi:NADH-quinone oxidoreductase subunit G